MVENKEVMATNIKYYMQKKGVNSAEVCKALGFKQNTFSNWINAEYYPRIDKIEAMANYFGVKKSALVEDHPLTFDTAEQFEKAWNDAGGGRHPIDLTDEEYTMVVNYRCCDDALKDTVRRMLAYQSKMRE